MSFLKITRLEPCRVVSFHVRDFLKPEDEVFSHFRQWIEANGLAPAGRLPPVLGFNNPWGPAGEPRGYEILFPLPDSEDVVLSGVVVKDFPGGLYAVATVPGLDVIPEYAAQLRATIDSHPRYVTAYPADYRHGVDPSPELEMVYTPMAQKAANFVLDYFIPIEETAQAASQSAREEPCPRGRQSDKQRS